MLNTIDAIKSHLDQRGIDFIIPQRDNQVIIVSCDKFSTYIDREGVMVANNNFDNLIDSQYSRVSFQHDSIQFFNGDNHVWTIFNEDLRKLV